MLGWMCGRIRCDRIKNEVIRDKGGIDLHGGQDKGSEIEMVWICDEAGFRHPNDEVREVGYSRREEG